MAGRNLILCLDGTSNKFSNANTNVVKIYAMLDREDPAQLMYYQPGIGTISPPGVWGKMKQRVVKTLDLAIALLLEDHTCDAYRFLMRTYEPNDKIFIFGFSRGAYTARVLAGMLHTVGLLSRGNEELIPFAWEIFSQLKKAQHRDSKEAEDEKKREASEFCATFSRQVKIEFLGLWDTVSSVGWALPLGSQSFPFTANNPDVNHVQHAVALDERRSYFPQNLLGTKLRGGQTVEEVWFAGVHCDIGGGYPEEEAGLSKITLRWMMRSAEKAGLKFNADRVQKELPSADMPGSAAPNVLALQHESLQGAWWIVEYVPKRFKVKVAEGEFKEKVGFHNGRHRHVLDNAKIHASVFRRKQLLGTCYNPSNLPASYQTIDESDPPQPGLLIPSYCECFDTAYDIKPGVPYCFRATGKWIDKNPPAVDAGGDPHAGFVRGLFTRYKRVPNAPYMALLGKIGDGAWFVIGKDESPRTPPGAGRLYCCANDVPGYYGNNRGLLQLEIREAAPEDQQSLNQGTA